MTGRIWVDPPSGWRYGFPKIYDPDKDGDMTEWLAAQGYPEEGEPSYVRCWAVEEKEHNES